MLHLRRDHGCLVLKAKVIMEEAGEEDVGDANKAPPVAAVEEGVLGQRGIVAAAALAGRSEIDQLEVELVHWPHLVTVALALHQDCRLTHEGAALQFGA